MSGPNSTVEPVLGGPLALSTPKGGILGHGVALVFVECIAFTSTCTFPLQKL
jgi:hypothetical protein